MRGFVVGMFAGALLAAPTDAGAQVVVNDRVTNDNHTGSDCMHAGQVCLNYSFVWSPSSPGAMSGTGTVFYEYLSTTPALIFHHGTDLPFDQISTIPGGSAL